MHSKVHLTLYPKMSGSRWVITTSRLSGSLRSFFLYSSSVYYCHLFFISSTSVRSIAFLSFFVPIFAWNIPLGTLIFLKRSLTFSILSFSSVSLHCSLRKSLLLLFAILWNSAFRWVYLSFSPLPFPFGCESWTIKMAEHWRIAASISWYWRRLLRVPWTARRSNLSVLKEINPEYLLEGLILKLKLQYFDPLVWRADSLEKTLLLIKIEGRREGNIRRSNG